MQLVGLIMLRQFLRKTYHNDIQQIQIALPFIRADQVFFGQMNMTHGVFLHIHTDPDGIDTFDVIVARILKIPFFLGRNQSAHVEDCPVQDLIFAGFILLCFHINNDLRKAILHPHIKYNVKTHQAFVQFLILCIKTNKALTILKMHRIRQSRLHRHGADIRKSLYQCCYLERIHPLKFLHGLHQDPRQDDLMCYQAFCAVIVLGVSVCCHYCTL